VLPPEVLAAPPPSAADAQRDLLRIAARAQGVATERQLGGYFRLRAGYARYALGLAGARSVPVAAGADVSLGRFRFRPGYPPDERYWPRPIPPAPGPLESALDLLRSAASGDAVVVALGPFTNLALLEEWHPGTLAALGPQRLVLMGGHVRPVPAGFPRWDGHEGDYNVQLDAAAARFVLERTRPTLVPIEVTVQTALRRAHLASLEHAGPLGALVARQADACATDWRNEERYGRTCAGLPRDTIAFLHDPLACAVAVGWDGVGVETLPLTLHEAEGILSQEADPLGRPTRVVTRVDGAAFGDLWCATLVGAA
jgi:purine nucleosidase